MSLGEPALTIPVATFDHRLSTHEVSSRQDPVTRRTTMAPDLAGDCPSRWGGMREPEITCGALPPNRQGIATLVSQVVAVSVPVPPVASVGSHTTRQGVDTGLAIQLVVAAQAGDGVVTVLTGDRVDSIGSR